ncbi:hypothetical protein D9M71_170000 [compost metagenome]
MPVAPAAAFGQVLWQALGQLVGVLPAAQAQQQAQAPFCDGVVAQLRVIAGHQIQGAAVIATCQGQANFASNGDLLVPRKVHALGVVVEHAHGTLGVLLGQATQAQADHIGHGLVDRSKARRLIEQFGLLRHLDQQFTLGGEGGQASGQLIGQAIVTCLGGELGALPAFLFGQLAFCGPALEQHIAGLRLRFTHKPELFGIGKAFGAVAVADLVLRVKAVKLGEVELGVVIFNERLPIATLGQPTQPTQFHPVGLGQVAMFGEKTLDLGVAGGFQPGGQFVVGKVRLQRVIAQDLFIAKIRVGVALGQCALGFIIILALQGKVGGLDGRDGRGSEKQAR